MKKILFLLVFTVLSYSQESVKSNVNLINYELITDSNGNKISTDYLLFSARNKSLYMTKKSYNKNYVKSELVMLKDTNTTKEEINSVVKIDTKNHLFCIIKDFQKDSLIFTNYAGNKSYKIEEKNSDFNWVFIDETKIIDSIKCKKAITNFRGRNYTAWFAEEIPIFDGPHKFSGLPGLIIELYDSELKYYWIVKSIQYNAANEEVFNINLEYPKIDLRTSVKYSDEELLRLVKINQSRLPKDSKSEDLVIKRGGIELKYEWE